MSDDKKSAVAVDTNSTELISVSAPKKGLKAKLARFWPWYKSHKKLAIPLTILLVLVVLMIIPSTRYKILGLFISKNISVYVLDSKTDTVVSDAEVVLGSVSAKTNGRGVAELNDVPVGQYTMKVSKKYYNDYYTDTTVTTASNQAFTLKLEATGRPVGVKVVDKISGKKLENVNVKAGEIEGTTDEKGELTLIVPAGTTKLEADFNKGGYLYKKSTLVVNDKDIVINDVSLTVAGKIYFLSKASGKIDVVQTNLDGSERKTVLAGTGKEEDYSTVLLASRDWKYLALYSKRDDKPAKIYLIETTAGDKLTAMDEGDASFDLVGWSNNKFVYKVNRNAPKQWESKKYALKSYDATAKKINVIDESQAVGNSTDFAWQIFSDVYIIDSNLIYKKNWEQSYYFSSIINDKKDEVLKVADSGGSKKLLKDFQNTAGTASYNNSFLYEPREVYFQAFYSGTEKYYEYTSDGQFKEDTNIKNDFEKYYGGAGVTYLLSPAAKENFWRESRDGKSILFLGDQDAGKESQIASLSDKYQTYGWFYDEYLLVSKEGSELFIMSRAGAKTEAELTKISDYHKPAYSYYSYGGGYGGL